jgi:hypothetical protein
MTSFHGINRGGKAWRERKRTTRDLAIRIVGSVGSVYTVGLAFWWIGGKTVDRRDTRKGRRVGANGVVDSIIWSRVRAGLISR